MAGTGMTWRGQQVKAAMRGAATRGLVDGADHLLQVSQTEVPVDEGTLRGTGAVHIVTDTKVAVSYDTPYAVRQHEELGYRHPKQGKAKYLEDPMRSEAPEVRRLVQAAIRRATR